MAGASFSANAETITLPAFLEAATREHPVARAIEAQHAADQAVAGSQGRLARPALELEAENLGGDAAGNAEEVTAIWSQPLPRPGEWTAGKALRRSALAAANAQAAQARKDLVIRATAAYFGAQAAADKAAFAQRAATEAERLVRVIQQRVTSGSATGFELLQARNTAAEFEVARQQASRNLNQATLLLQQWSGDPSLTPPDLARLPVPPPPKPEIIQTWVDQSPQARLAALHSAQTEARYRVARAHRWPAWTAGVGIREDRASGEQTFVAAIEIEWPFSKQTRASFRGARAQHEAALAQQEAAALERSRYAHSAANELTALYAQHLTFRDQRLPDIDQQKTLGQTLFEQGSVTTLELLDTLERWSNLHQEAADLRLRYRITLRSVQPVDTSLPLPAPKQETHQ